MSSSRDTAGTNAKPHNVPSTEELRVWDRSALLRRVLGDEAFLRELIALFRDEAAGYLDAIERGFATQDWTGVAGAAHQLKAAAASLAAEALRQAAADVEAWARDHAAGREPAAADGAAHAADVARLRTAMHRLLAVLSAEP